MKFRAGGRLYKAAKTAPMLTQLILAFKGLKNGFYIHPKTFQIINIQYKALGDTIYVYQSWAEL